MLNELYLLNDEEPCVSCGKLGENYFGYCDACDEKFSAIMDAKIRPKKITIHTANPSAAVRMARILNENGIDCTIHESEQPFPKECKGL